jgi:hypothetical protein
MSLKDLRSNLTLGDLSTKDDIAKGLTFGKGRAYDRPHQSFSLEPFVKDNINMGGTSTANLLTDGFIRGGYLMHLERAIQDTERLLTFSLSTRGIAWNLKQLGLQLSNPKISEPSKQSSPFKFSPADQRTWNFGLNTIAQIAGQGTGLHVKREGLFPTSKEGYIDSNRNNPLYIDLFANYKPNSNTNRLLYLYDNHIGVKTAKIQPFADNSVRALNITATTRLGQFVQKTANKIINFLDNSKGGDLYSYAGGPGSTYGIGSTHIYKYLNSTPDKSFHYIDPYRNEWDGSGYSIDNTHFLDGESVGPFKASHLVYKPSFIAHKKKYGNGAEKYMKINKKDIAGLENIGDFAGKQDMNFGTPTPVEIDSFTRLGDPMKTGIIGPSYFINSPILKIKSSHDYHKIFGPAVSLIPFQIPSTHPKVKNYLYTLGKLVDKNQPSNYEKLVSGSDSITYHREKRVNLGNPGGDPYNGNTTVDLINALDVFTSTNGNFNKQEVRDLIRFRIEAVDPTKPTTSNVMVFRAFLDTLSDSFNAGYNEFKYNGRGESFYTYDSFNRDISFSFKIAAQSAREMKPLYRKLNYLASNTAPEYNQTSGRMMTPFMRLTIGSYFHRLPGVIKTIGIQWQKDYPWDICIDAPEGGSDAKMFVLPHVLDVNITYQPIHDFLPQKGIHSPFIIPPKDAFSSQPERQKWITEEIEANLNGAVSKIKKSSLDLTDIPNVKYQALGPKFKNQQSEAIIKVRDLEETRIIQNTLDHMNELSSVVKETGNEHQEIIYDEFGFPIGRK